MRTALLLLTLFALGLTPACSTMTVDSAQGALEPYSFSFEGNANGLVAFNARYLAIDAQTDLTAYFRNRTTVLWQQSFQAGAGRRAYRIVFNENDEFVQLLPVSWEEARVSLTWLPGDPTP